MGVKKFGLESIVAAVQNIFLNERSFEKDNLGTLTEKSVDVLLSFYKIINQIILQKIIALIEKNQEKSEKEIESEKKLLLDLTEKEIENGSNNFYLRCSLSRRYLEHDKFIKTKNILNKIYLPTKQKNIVNVFTYSHVNIFLFYFYFLFFFLIK